MLDSRSERSPYRGPGRFLLVAGLLILGVPSASLAQSAPPSAEPKAAAEPKVAAEKSSPTSTEATGAEAAKAEAPGAAAQPAPRAAEQTAPQQKSAEKPAGAADVQKPAFVDRDGDGIQDGQEHRFRHRKSAGKHRAGDADDGSGGVRARNRTGQEEGGQHRGGR